MPALAPVMVKAVFLRLCVTFSFHTWLLDVALPAVPIIRDVSRDVKVK